MREGRYPGYVIPTRSVRLAAEYLADVMEEDIGTNNGKTAFFWHVVSVIQKHGTPRSPAASPGTSPEGAPTGDQGGT